MNVPPYLGFSVGVDVEVGWGAAVVFPGADVLDGGGAGAVVDGVVGVVGPQETSTTTAAVRTDTISQSILFFTRFPLVSSQLVNFIRIFLIKGMSTPSL